MRWEVRQGSWDGRQSVMVMVVVVGDGGDGGAWPAPLPFLHHCPSSLPPPSPRGLCPEKQDLHPSRTSVGAKLRRPASPQPLPRPRGPAGPAPLSGPRAPLCARCPPRLWPRWALLAPPCAGTARASRDTSGWRIWPAWPPPRPPLQEAPATPSPLPAQLLEAGPPVTYACAGPRAPGGPRQRLRGRGAAAGCSLSRSCRGPGGGWGTGRRKRRRRTGGGGGGGQGERGRGRRGAGHPAAAARTQALLLWPATLLGAVLPGPPPQNLPRETRVPPPGGWGERKRRGRRKEECVCVCVCVFLLNRDALHPPPRPPAIL